MFIWNERNKDKTSMHWNWSFLLWLKHHFPHFCNFLDDDITTAIEKLETQKSIISSFSKNIQNPRVSQSVSMPASAWSSQSSKTSAWAMPSSPSSWISSASSSCASTPQSSSPWLKQSNFSSWSSNSSSHNSKNCSNERSSVFVFSAPAPPAPSSKGLNSRSNFDSRSTSNSSSSYQNDRLLQMD